MTKIIEAKAIISAEDKTGAGFKSAMDKINAMTKAQNAFAKSGAKDIAMFTGHVDQMNRRLSAVEGFRAQHEALKQSRQQFRAAQDEVIRLGRAMKEAEKPTRSMTLEYERSQRAVKQAAAAFQEKVVAVKAAKAEMAAYGVTLKNLNVKQAEAFRTVAATGGRSGPAPAYAPLPGRRAAAAKVAPQQEAAGGMGVVALTPGMIGPAAAAYGAVKLHGAVVDKHHSFQQAYLYQQAVLGMDSAAQQPLLNQAVKIGQDTKFTNADIVRAQTDIGSKLPKESQNTATIAAITEHTKNYALAMQVSMEEASVAMVGRMKALGYDLSSPAAAEKSARRTANQLVEFAKTTGAKHHDLIGDTKFGAAPGRVGGFSEEFSNALSAQLIRQGYEGAMSGTFVRAAAMKLSAPTQKGMSAIASMGINYGDYVKPGVDVSVGGFGKMLQQRFGRGIDASQTAKLESIFNDPEKMGDRGSFVEAVSEALSSSFARKTKGGKINAQDAERIAKTANEFHSLTASGVDSERMMMDIIRRGMTPAFAKFLFGTEHGGRAVGLNADQLERDLKTFKSVPDNRAEGVAAKMQEGAQGEYTKMTGSVETFVTALGEATDKTRAFAYKGVGALFDAMTDLVKGKKTDLAKDVEASKDFSFNKSGRGAEMGDGRSFSGYDGYGDQLIRRFKGGDASERPGAAALDLSKVSAKVEQPVPVDVTGKVALDPSSKVDVNVSVKVQGPAAVTGQSVSAGGNAKGTVGTSTAGSYE